MMMMKKRKKMSMRVLKRENKQASCDPDEREEV